MVNVVTSTTKIGVEVVLIGRESAARARTAHPACIAVYVVKGVEAKKSDASGAHRGIHNQLILAEDAFGCVLINVVQGAKGANRWVMRVSARRNRRVDISREQLIEPTRVQVRDRDRSGFRDLTLQAKRALQDVRRA